jgi:hypothetical protein
MEETSTPRGKIARLPARLREQVCRWLHDGQPASVILPKLNELPDVQAMLAQHFSGEPITPDNLSAWRRGQYQKWLSQREEIERTKERALFSLEVAKASGGNLSEGALAQLTGEIMEVVEEISAIRRAGGEVNPKALAAINKSLVAARAKELDTQAHRLKLKQLEQRDRELDLAEEKFRMQFAEAFLKFYNDAKAREIADSKADKTVKMDQLVELIFGAKPDRKEGAA